MYLNRPASFFFAVLMFIGFTSLAQDQPAVSWKATGKKTGEGQYQVQLKGTIRPGWYLYAKPVVDAGIEEIALILPDSAIQKTRPAVLSGNIRSIKDKVFGIQAEVALDSISIIQDISTTGEMPSLLKLTLAYNTAGNESFIPEEAKIDVAIEGGVDNSQSNRILVSAIDLNKPVNDCGGTDSITGDLLGIFLLGFIGGLLALVTPCVFPMIPLTVSFFTKKALSKRQGVFHASIYGFFIFLIYVLLSVPFYFVESASPEILNSVSTNPWLNIIFFVVFILFALSFFGLYEITLPSSISGKADSKSGTGNILGIFFMALTLAIVSFSCTGPILGSLLVGSLSGSGGAIQLTAGMGGFGLALALPFALFAMFPNWLNSLPKSGGWLHSVKIVLGFVEVGLAIKFLSNADLVEHWGLLKREVFIAIWVLCGVGITLYLVGLLRFPLDNPAERPGKLRYFFAAVFAVFTLYLVPGVTNTRYANLTLISGFPPPLCYSIFDNPINCRGFDPIKDYELALQKARKENKPILIDFTGYACVNCRRMEENVWVNDEIKKLLTEKFVLVSLYVDDKKNLPASKQFTYTNKEGITKEIVTVGDKWATFQTENFRNNAQPLYAILNGDEILLNRPVGYTPSVKEYKNWLLCGLEAFEKTKR
jgi:thiol:disulfide interchange protein